MREEEQTTSKDTVLLLLKDSSMLILTVTRQGQLQGETPTAAPRGAGELGVKHHKERQKLNGLNNFN